MADLIVFAKHLEEVILDADRVPHWTPQTAQEYMAAYGARGRQFEELADHLNYEIIEPRLETVASFFINASLLRDEVPNRSSCWFEYCDRFPATANIEFSVEHDVRLEHLIIRAGIHVMPVFVRFSEQDQMPFPIDHVEEEKVADWVEERLLEFLDTYLRIDCGGEELEGEPATDPICGMRIRRSDAAASDSFYGHAYYFCSEDCHQTFRQDPERYVQVRML